MRTLLLAMSDFLDPGRGPDQSGEFEVSPGLFIGMFGIGFLLAVAGHIIRSRTLVGAGIAVIFLSTVLVPVLLHATR